MQKHVLDLGIWGTSTGKRVHGILYRPEACMICESVLHKCEVRDSVG